MFDKISDYLHQLPIGLKLCLLAGFYWIQVTLSLMEHGVRSVWEILNWLFISRQNGGYLNFHRRNTQDFKDFKLLLTEDTTVSLESDDDKYYIPQMNQTGRFSLNQFNSKGNISLGYYQPQRSVTISPKVLFLDDMLDPLSDLNFLEACNALKLDWINTGSSDRIKSMSASKFSINGAKSHDDELAWMTLHLKSIIRCLERFSDIDTIVARGYAAYLVSILFGILTNEVPRQGFKITADDLTKLNEQNFLPFGIDILAKLRISGSVRRSLMAKTGKLVLLSPSFPIDDSWLSFEQNLNVLISRNVRISWFRVPLLDNVYNLIKSKIGSELSKDSNLRKFEKFYESTGYNHVPFQYDYIIQSIKAWIKGNTVPKPFHPRFNLRPVQRFKHVNNQLDARKSLMQSSNQSLVDEQPNLFSANSFSSWWAPSISRSTQVNQYESVTTRVQNEEEEVQAATIFATPEQSNNICIQVLIDGKAHPRQLSEWWKIQLENCLEKNLENIQGTISIPIKLKTESFVCNSKNVKKDSQKLLAAIKMK